MPSVALATQPAAAQETGSESARDTSAVPAVTDEAAAAALAAAADPRVFVGKYTDPKHPGGYREITLLDTFDGDLRMAKVEGGGGRNEPQFFTLPATIGKRLLDKRIWGGDGKPRFVITIDFTPKGGPANFYGVWDKDGITFLGDSNHWPKGDAKKKKQRKKGDKFTFVPYSV